METQKQGPSTLLKLREQAGLTQRQVASALDVTTTTISSWENGRHEPRLTFTQMRILAEVLGCSLDELVTAGSSKH